MKTQADHARAYRQRKAAKLERLQRLETALENIAAVTDPGDQANALAVAALAK